MIITQNDRRMQQGFGQHALHEFIEISEAMAVFAWSKCNMGNASGHDIALQPASLHLQGTNISTNAF